MPSVDLHSHMFWAKFVLEYIKDWNGSRAIRDAGYTGDFARQEAWRLLQKPAIKKEVEQHRKAIIGELKLDVAEVVSGIKTVLTADARQLTEYRRSACRYCHGLCHLYHYTPQEMRDAYNFHIQSDAYINRGVAFDAKGGDGYNPTKDPHPHCPECFGEGIGRAYIHDTRTLSPEAVALYAGVEQTASGVKINMQSQEKAREAAARFLGMNKETVNLVETAPSGLSHFYGGNNPTTTDSNAKPGPSPVLDDAGKK